MSHRPLHPPWKLDKEGKPLRDRDGNKVRHPKGGTAKKPSEWTAEERESIEFQERAYAARERAWASHQLGDLVHAAQIFNKREAGVK